MKVLGKPGEDALEAASEPAVKWIAKQPDIQPTPMGQVVPDASASALDLLQRLLHFSPRLRCTAQEALEHPYLADYHDRKYYWPGIFPSSTFSPNFALCFSAQLIPRYPLTRLPSNLSATSAA